MVSAVEPVSRLPPVRASYHLIAVPVADKFETAGLLPEQNICKALPVGADGAVGAALITTLAERPELHPAALVTVKL